MAAGGDLAFPAVPGRRTRKDRLTGVYLTRLHAAAAEDAHLAAAFLRVAGLVSPPPSLLRPGIALRVLWGGRVAIAPPRSRKLPPPKQAPRRGLSRNLRRVGTARRRIGQRRTR